MSTSATHVLTNTKRFSQILMQALGGALLIALAAQVKIPLPFTPVPLSLQTFAIMLIGGMLGPWQGILATLSYLGLGCIGLPVFAGGLSDPLALVGPRGGYLLGFILLAYLSGKISEKRTTFWKAIPLLFFSTMAVLGIGALWLSYFVGIENCLIMGVIPFVPGDFLKVIAAAAFLAKRK